MEMTRFEYLAFLSVFIYLIPVILVGFWMLRMLKNSNENLKINREILEILKKNREL